MGPEIISYIALGIILVIGVFITIHAFKFKWGKVPLFPGEDVVYEEQKVKFRYEFGNTAQRYLPQAVKITNQRMFIFKKFPYILMIVDFTHTSTEKTKDELKGTIFVRQSDFVVEMDEKSHAYVLRFKAPNIAGIEVTYTLWFEDINKVKLALNI